MCASFDSHAEYIGLESEFGYYAKINQPPAIRPFDDTNSGFPPVTDPVYMAQYIYNALTLNHLDAQNVNFQDRDYRSFAEREAIFNKLLNEGITICTPIRAIRVTKPGEHYLAEYSDQFAPNAELISSIKVTDIFTEGYSFATTGATVCIRGFEGPWKALNGKYVNGVAITEEGAVPNPRSAFVDISSDKKEGTFQNVYNHFQLRFNSCNAKKFPRDNEGWAKCLKGNPFVKVTHRITSDMEYPAFFAAMRAMFYLMYQVSQHTGRFNARFAPGSIFLFNTWEELKNNVAIGNFWGNLGGDTLVRSRTAQAVPSGFFNNVTLARRGLTTYNDPFGLTQQPGSKYDYNIVMANYLDQSKIRNLYWAIAGTPATNPGDPTAPNGQFLQFDPAILAPDYKPAFPGPQKAEFVGALGNVAMVNGRPQPQFPAIDPNGTYFSLIGDQIAAGADSTFLSNAYYVGLIDQSLTGGKKIGYLRWQDEGALDPFLYMLTSLFPPIAAQLPPANPRYGREAAAQVFSNWTRYLNNEGCESVILDIRSNNGGFSELAFTLAEFFGDDRAATFKRWSRKDSGNSALLNFADNSQFSFVNDVAAKSAASFSKFYVQQNEATYPGSVFRGSAGQPKKVIILTDHAAASGGDYFPHVLMGENLDGNLGSNTTATIIGDIDGRLKGASTTRMPTPASRFMNGFYDSNGNPFPPIRYSADWAVGIFFNGLTGIPFNIQTELLAPSPAPSLKGAAGGNPLPNDWHTNVWPALGFIPAPAGLFDASIAKGLPNPNDRSSWRDPWLEQAVLAAIS